MEDIRRRAQTVIREWEGEAKSVVSVNASTYIGGIEIYIWGNKKSFENLIL